MARLFWVNGVVAQRDKKPYIQLSNENGMMAQLSLGEARNVAHDILLMCARTEMDAMVLKFYEQSNFSPPAATQMMQMFREYRAEVDQELVESSHDGSDPAEGQ